MTPFTVVPRSIFCDSGTSLFGSFSFASIRSPTTNDRGLLAPHFPTNRRSYTPGGTSAAAVTLNLCGPAGVGFGAGIIFFGSFGSGVGSFGGARYSPFNPGCANRSFSGSSTSNPVTVTSVAVPAFTPAGNTFCTRGDGRPGGGCWATAVPQAAKTTRPSTSRRMGESPRWVVRRADGKARSGGMG